MDKIFQMATDAVKSLPLHDDTRSIVFLKKQRKLAAGIVV
jgi:hypothetical protein